MEDFPLLALSLCCTCHCLPAALGLAVSAVKGSSHCEDRTEHRLVTCRRVSSGQPADGDGLARRTVGFIFVVSRLASVL